MRAYAQKQIYLSVVLEQLPDESAHKRLLLLVRSFGRRRGAHLTYWIGAPVTRTCFYDDPAGRLGTVRHLCDT